MSYKVESDGNGGYNINVQRSTAKKHGGILATLLSIVLGGSGVIGFTGAENLKEGAVNKEKVEQLETKQQATIIKLEALEDTVEDNKFEMIEEMHANKIMILKAIIDLKEDQ